MKKGIDITEANRGLCKALGIDITTIEEITITASRERWDIRVKVIEQPKLAKLVEVICRIIENAKDGQQHG